MRMVLFMTLLAALSASAQDKQIKKVPITPTNAWSGQQMFNTYCAACHGVDAKGDGPAASALKVAPTDLTQLKKNNGGKFPENRVTATLRAVDTPVHGSKEMPVWGPLLSSVSTSDAEVQLRTANLIRYLESMQEK
jgi:mono/diheme cytochrome c family protein